MATHTPTTPAPAGANAPSRRQLLGSGALAALTGAGFAAVVLSPDPVWGEAERRAGTTFQTPDAALLALCARFHALHAEAEATDADTDTALTDALERRQEVQHQIQPIRPTTPAGQAAKARVAMQMLDEAFGPRVAGDFLDFGLTTLAEIAGVAPPAAAEDHGVALAEPAAFPDAELLEACADADAVQRRMDVLYTGPTRVEDDAERDALLAPLQDEQEPFLEKVCDLRATTLAGHMARAHTLALWDKEALKPADASWNSYISAALVRDLLWEDRA